MQCYLYSNRLGVNIFRVGKSVLLGEEQTGFLGRVELYFLMLGALDDLSDEQFGQFLFLFV